MLPNMPKLESPFVRKTYKLNEDDWRRYGADLCLRTPEVYLVTPEIDPRLEWVWDDDTYAVEKLHGTNISIDIQKGYIKQVQNRKNVVDLLKIKGKGGLSSPGSRIFEGILNAVDRGYLEDNKVQYGELIGPRLNKNIHLLDKHLWYPFNKARKSLVYKSFREYPKEFWRWCEWFRTDLKSLLYCRLNNIPFSNMTFEGVPFAEGFVVYKNNKEDPERAKMAKLRRDMFPWYYWKKIEIIGLEDHWIEYAKDVGINYIKGYLRGDGYVEGESE